MSGQLLAAPLSFLFSLGEAASQHVNHAPKRCVSPYSLGSRTRWGRLIFFQYSQKRWSMKKILWDFFAAKYVKMSLHNFWYE